jgi:hypothetical protein
MSSPRKELRVHLDADLHDRISELARLKGLTLTVLVERLLSRDDVLELFDEQTEKMMKAARR